MEIFDAGDDGALISVSQVELQYILTAVRGKSTDVDIALISSVFAGSHNLCGLPQPEKAIKALSTLTENQLRDVIASVSICFFKYFHKRVTNGS